MSAVDPKRKVGLQEPVPSYVWLADGLSKTKEGLLVQYDFTLSPHDNARLKSKLQQLLKDGRVTKEPARVKQWAGVTIVKAIVHAYLARAPREGTQNWDFTISRTASIVLLSALQCRAGEILACVAIATNRISLPWKTSASASMGVESWIT